MSHAVTDKLKYEGRRGGLKLTSLQKKLPSKSPALLGLSRLKTREETCRQIFLY